MKASPVLIRQSDRRLFLRVISDGLKDLTGAKRKYHGLQDSSDIVYSAAFLETIHQLL